MQHSSRKRRPSVLLRESENQEARGTVTADYRNSAYHLLHIRPNAKPVAIEPDDSGDFAGSPAIKVWNFRNASVPPSLQRFLAAAQASAPYAVLLVKE